MPRRQELNILQVGKAGLTENVIEEAIQLLKKHKIIKVKFLPTAIKDDKKKLVNELAEKANARIRQRVGFTAVLVRKKN